MANLKGQLRDKPFRDALRMEMLALANGDRIEHPCGSLRWNAQQLLMRGDTISIKEVADRLDGRAVQQIEGTDGGALVVKILKVADGDHASE